MANLFEQVNKGINTAKGLVSETTNSVRKVAGQFFDSVSTDIGLGKKQRLANSDQLNKKMNMKLA